MIKAQVRGGGRYPQKSPGYPLACLPVFMYTRTPVPGEPDPLDDLLRAAGIAVAVDDQVDENQGYKVGAVDDDGTYQPRDRDDIEQEHYARELDEFRRQAEAARADMEVQRQSRYTLRAMGFVFTDEGASVFEAMGGTVEYDDDGSQVEHFFDPPPSTHQGLPDWVMRFIQ